MVSLKRGILVFGCAVIAFPAIPVLAASPAGACPYGTVERSPGVCTNGGQAGGPVVPPQAAPPGPVVSNQNGYTSVNNIPCTPEHYAYCISQTN